MAKKMYIGVNGVARKVKKPYIGVYQDKETTPYGLPTGYTALEYIQSDNSCNIDTGVVIGSSDAVLEMDIQNCSVSSEQNWFAQFSTNYVSSYAGMLQLGAYNSKWGYHFPSVTVSGVGTMTADRTKVNVTISGDTLTFSGDVSGSYTNSAVSSGAYRNNSITILRGIWRCYGVKISVAGVLVRDLKPCKNPSGTIGMYDMVNATFYANTGTGTLTAGAVIPNILAGERARRVIKGYIGVNGVARKFYQAGEPITKYSVGDILKINVNGTLTDFIIVNIGKPSSMYDDSCDGYWLLAKDIYTNMVWHSTGSTYKDSDLHTYLNGTFLNMLTDIKSSVKQVKLPYVNGLGGSAIASGSNGLSAKVFLLGGYEVGWTTSNHQYLPVDGAKLSYFDSGDNTSANNKRIAYKTGSASMWWLRSPYNTGNAGFGWYVAHDGKVYNSGKPYSTWGVRPALILDYSCEVSEDKVVLG